MSQFVDEPLRAARAAAHSRQPHPDEIFWEPSEKQSEMLACDDFEVLYGGAAGGGKTDALLIDACCLQHDGIWNRHHRAILFRRTYPELRDMIDRSLDLYKVLDPLAKYNSTEKVWTFSSGAKIEFGHLQHDSDRFKYRGRAWNYIGFDELTLWPTDTCYVYLFSRCRSTDRSLPRYIRATTNPDGPGQRWVMVRFAINPAGEPSRVPVELVDEDAGIVTTLYRRFIPARLVDNKHLANTGYKEALLQQDPETRDALLKGLWNATKVKGAIYQGEMAKLRQEGRIRHVPHTVGVPVNTFWDIGWNDTNAIWFHQFVYGEDRFIDYYENSGEAFAHYLNVLFGSGGPTGSTHRKDYVYGRHYLPHDGANHTPQTGKSNLLVLQELAPSQRFEIVPRTPQIFIGINQTRMRLRGNVVFDSARCYDGIAYLDLYQKRYVERTDSYADEPLHNQASNCADAIRQWGQGFMPRNANPDGTPAPGVKRRPIARRSGMAA